MAVILGVNNAVFEFQDARADVILKYSADEARNLKSYGEFPENVKINETVNFDPEAVDDDIEFDDVDSSDEENDLGVDGIDNIWKPLLFRLKKIFFSFSSEIPRLQNLIPVFKISSAE